MAGHLSDTPTMARFQYDPEIVETYPQIVGGVIHATGVANGPTTPVLAAAYRFVQQEAIARIGTTPLSRDPLACCLASGIPGLRRRPHAVSVGGRGTPAPTDQAG